MTERKTYYVTAKHVSPNYCFTRHPVTVSRDSLDGTYYADAAKLGCGKNYKTAEIAIRELFQAHACDVTNIETV